MRVFTPIALLLLPLIATGQQNLVPNPSFEEHTACPNAPGKIWLATPWEKVGGGGGYDLLSRMRSCLLRHSRKQGGGGYARTGQAYADILLLYNNHVLPSTQEGNFLGTHLLQSLDTGKKYNVGLYLSLMDSMHIACKNIGAYFSIGKPTQTGWSPEFTTTHLLSLVPQVRYEGDFLIDKEGWMEISGSFTAQGGENYITIGNFDGYFNSDTINLHSGGVFPNIGYWETSAYFIDDVSVIEDRSIGVEEAQGRKFSLHPNPANDAFIVDAEHGRQVTLYDMAGRTVLHTPMLSSKETIGIGFLPSGVYAVAVEMQDGSVVRQRLVRQ